MFGQFDGLKRLAMIIGIEEAIPIIDRVNILQTAIADNVSKPKDAVRDIALMRSDLNLLKKLGCKEHVEQLCFIRTFVLVRSSHPC